MHVIDYSTGRDADRVTQVICFIVLGVTLLCGADVAMKIALWPPVAWTDWDVQLFVTYVDPYREQAVRAVVGVMIAVSLVCASTMLWTRRVQVKRWVVCLGWIAIVGDAQVPLQRWWGVCIGGM